MTHWNQAAAIFDRETTYPLAPGEDHLTELLGAVLNPHFNVLVFGACKSIVEALHSHALITVVDHSRPMLDRLEAFQIQALHLSWFTMRVPALYRKFDMVITDGAALNLSPSQLVILRRTIAHVLKPTGFWFGREFTFAKRGHVMRYHADLASSTLRYMRMQELALKSKPRGRVALKQLAHQLEALPPCQAMAKVYRSAPEGDAYWIHRVEDFPCDEMQGSIEQNGIFTFCAQQPQVRI